MLYELEIWQNSMIWSIKDISVWNPGLSYATLLIIDLLISQNIIFH